MKYITVLMIVQIQNKISLENLNFKRNLKCKVIKHLVMKLFKEEEHCRQRELYTGLEKD